MRNASPTTVTSINQPLTEESLCRMTTKELQAFARLHFSSITRITQRARLLRAIIAQCRKSGMLSISD